MKLKKLFRGDYPSLLLKIPMYGMLKSFAIHSERFLFYFDFMTNISVKIFEVI